MKRNKQYLRSLIIMGLLITIVIPVIAQTQEEEDKVWNDFTAWIRSKPAKSTLKAYGEKLSLEGLSMDEVKRRLDVIRRFFREDPLKSASQLRCSTPIWPPSFIGHMAPLT